MLLNLPERYFFQVKYKYSLLQVVSLLLSLQILPFVFSSGNNRKVWDIVHRYKIHDIFWMTEQYSIDSHGDCSYNRCRPGPVVYPANNWFLITTTYWNTKYLCVHNINKKLCLEMCFEVRLNCHMLTVKPYYFKEFFKENYYFKKCKEKCKINFNWGCLGCVNHLT